MPCDGCTNDFAVDSEMLQQNGASVALVPHPGEVGWTTRVRLYVDRATSEVASKPVRNLEGG